MVFNDWLLGENRNQVPGMPRTAVDLGLHYARIAVSGEPLQATQFWTTLVSLMPFHDGPVDAAIDAAYAAVDPASAMAEVVVDARHLHHAYRDDWKAARHAIHEKWVVEKKWNQNSTPAKGALVLLALLYGEGDFYPLRQPAPTVPARRMPGLQPGRHASARLRTPHPRPRGRGHLSGWRTGIPHPPAGARVDAAAAAPQSMSLPSLPPHTPPSANPCTL